MSPEAAIDPKLCELFKCQHVKKNLVLVAIDEPHRITEWYVTCVLQKILWEFFDLYKLNANKYNPQNFPLFGNNYTYNIY